MAWTRVGRRASPGRATMTLAVAAVLAVTMAACKTNDSPTRAGVPVAQSPPLPGAAAPTTKAPAPATPTTVTATASTAASATNVATVANPALGTILVDAAGKTLYVFDRDAGGVSACTGGCAATWPALVLAMGATTPTAASGVSGLTLVSRPDDSTKMQIVLGGRPLYTFAADGPGETKGDGVGGNWHVAKPA